MADLNVLEGEAPAQPLFVVGHKKLGKSLALQ
jgi:hypothetical protein